MPTDLELAFAALTSKQTVYDVLWDYYDGDHPLVYSTARLRKIFEKINTKFVENWCAVIIDSVLERLLLKQFTVGSNEDAQIRLGDLWDSTGLELDSDDAHLAMLVAGEAFIIAWREEGEDVQAYYNDPRLCHVQYDPENPHKKIWAAKWWSVEDGTYRLTLYYGDRLEYYHTTKKSIEGQTELNVPASASAFRPSEPDQAKNPFGVIPVFHYKRELRGILSELNPSIITMQVAVNKLFSDMMVSAEFNAFPQRWVISNSDNIGELENFPSNIWEIPAGDGQGQSASVGQLAAAQLDNYTKAMDRIANALSSISRTPRHFFFTQGGTPSGEALIALEAPLNKKVKKYQKRLGKVWRDVAAFLLKLDGMEVLPTDITSVWEPAQTVQPQMEATIRKTSVDSGIPLTTALRWEGKSNADIEQLQTDKAEEQAAATESLAAALIAQQRQFDQESNGEA